MFRIPNQSIIQYSIRNAHNNFPIFLKTVYFFYHLFIDFFFRLFFKNDLKCIKNTNTNFSTHKCYFLKEKKHPRSTIIAFVSINLRSAELQRRQFIIFLSLRRHYKMQCNA